MIKGKGTANNCKAEEHLRPRPAQKDKTGSMPSLKEMPTEIPQQPVPTNSHNKQAINVTAIKL